MVSNFSNKWETDRSREPTSQKIKETVSPPGNLRKKLTETDRSLQMQIMKLDKTIAHMGEKEKRLFTKTSVAFQKHDTLQAKAYANELAELRKAIKLVNSAKLALENVQVRLRTITDIGDLTMTLAPVGHVIKSVRRTLVQVMPSANSSFGEISSTLDGLMMEVGSIPTMGFSFDTSSEEAEKIIAEASAVAETKMASTLPSIPDIESGATDTSI
ncbi:MAG: Snf7 family protein [Nitrososphaerales archaeon]